MASSTPVMDWVLEAYLAEQFEHVGVLVDRFNRSGRVDVVSWDEQAGSLAIRFVTGAVAVFASGSPNCAHIEAMGALGPVSCVARVRPDGRVELTARMERWQYVVVADALVFSGEER